MVDISGELTTCAELGHVEEKYSALSGDEFRWQSKSMRTPQTWLNSYNGRARDLINREKLESLLCKGVC